MNPPFKPRLASSSLLLSFADSVALVIVLGILLLIFRNAQNFLTMDNFVGLANQNATTIIAAIGMTYVLVIAGIDLSVGSVLGLSAAVMGLMIEAYHWPVSGAIAAALFTGVVCGMLNGIITVRWALPSFIVTLGMLEAARGGCYTLTDMKTVYIGSAVSGLYQAKLMGLSLIFYVALALVIVGQVVLSFTVYGRYLVAIGTNEEAVRLSGINPRPIKVSVFVLCSLLAALAAVFQVSRDENIDPGAGNGLELSVIASVVIGGTSLAGGRGSVINSALGVMIISVLGAGLAARGVSEEKKRLITGCVIVAAVLADYYRRRLSERVSRL